MNLHLSSALIAILCGSIAVGVASPNFQDEKSEDQINPRDAFWSAADLLAVPAPGPRPKRSQKLAAKISLAVRYSILKRSPEDNTFKEVSAQSEFHTGDHMRFNVSSDREGYLYVIHQGSTGTWTPLYPRPGSSGTNKLLAGKSYLVPSDPGVWAFNADLGEEKLFVLLTLNPERNLDELIESLRTGTNGGSKTIRSQVIDHIERSRDIVYEELGGVGEDQASYVATKASDPHVVINVTLKHR